jgi:hypothetical protein
MGFDFIVDTIQTLALLGVMAVLCYLVYLLKLELGGAVAALHAIVKAQDAMQARLNVLEAEREHRR